MWLISVNKNYKKCSRCKKKFPATKEFFYKGGCKFGLRAECKACGNIYYKQYRKDNRDKNIKRHKEWHTKNAVHVKKYNKQYHEINREKRNENSRQRHIKKSEQEKQYRRNNRDKLLANALRYKIRKLNQMPPEADMELIQFYYTVATTLADYQVDHIKPLYKGGLHHQDNLQLLNSSLNQQKRSKWPLTPEEEIKYKGYKLGSKII